MPNQRTKKQRIKPGFETGQLAATILEIERGPRCRTCGVHYRSIHECKP